MRQARSSSMLSEGKERQPLNFRPFRSFRHGRFCIILAALLLTTGANATTFQVQTTLDTGPNTLRWAIASANVTPGPDTIVFSIPGGGPYVIAPASQLPQLTDPSGVLIDGLSQTGSNLGSNPPSTMNLRVILDGALAGASHGLWIASSNNIIRGLVIRGFQQDGIRIEGTLPGSFNNIITCNFIGTDRTGTIVQGNGTNRISPWGGVNILVTPGSSGIAQSNVVRRNLISGNYSEGVSISSCPPGDVAMNIVDTNLIGTDITGMLDRGNTSDGVYIGEAAHDNIIADNVIAGNDTNGVCIIGYVDEQTQWFTHHNHILRNLIGLAVDGLTPLPNGWDGVSIGIYGLVWKLGYANYNDVVDNDIAFNGRNGVMVYEHSSNNFNADGNTISQNRMYSNGLLGIDLGNNGVTLNDPNDPDTGPNEECNFPVIDSARISGSQMTFKGKADLTNPSTATIEIFQAQYDPSGYGEGMRFLGKTVPDAAGNWTFTATASLSHGDSITATTTDVNMNTSEFSKNFRVTDIGIQVHDLSKFVRDFSLQSAYPNPSDGCVEFKLVVSGYSRLRIAMFNALGKEVRLLDEAEYFPATYILQWDGISHEGKRLAPGLYFCSVQSEKGSMTLPVVLH